MAFGTRTSRAARLGLAMTLLAALIRLGESACGPSGAGITPNEVSASSCGDLGWSVFPGSAEVCAQGSAAPLPGCSSGKSWGCAVDFCESKGARLCTFRELIDGEVS